MEAALHEYLRYARIRLAPSTLRGRRYLLLRFFRFLDERQLTWDRARPSDVQAFLLTIQGVQRSRKDAWNALRGFYRYQRHPEPPTSGIRFRPERRRLPRVPSRECMNQAIDAVRTGRPVTELRDRLMVELAYGSGLRRAELARLDIEDLDMSGRSVYVHGKGDKPRIVPLTAKAVAAAKVYLDWRKANRGPIFVDSRFSVPRRLQPKAIGGLVKKRTGFRAHLLRHACASHLLAAGCGVRLIQELLGHKFLPTTQRYTHINPQELRLVVERFHPCASGRE